MLDYIVSMISKEYDNTIDLCSLKKWQDTYDADYIENVKSPGDTLAECVEFFKQREVELRAALSKANITVVDANIPEYL